MRPSHSGAKRDPVTEHQDILWIIRRLGNSYFSWRRVERSTLRPPTQVNKQKWTFMVTNVSLVSRIVGILSVLISLYDLRGPLGAHTHQCNPPRNIGYPVQARLCCWTTALVVLFDWTSTPGLMLWICRSHSK